MGNELQRRFLAGCPEQDPNPSLQDLLQDEEPPFIPRTDAEDRVFASLPGDDLSNHPLGPHTDNPYLNHSYRELKDMLEEDGLGREEQTQILSALNQHRQQHAHPYSIPGDATQR